MRVRESGMPEEQTWDGFFDPESILSKLDLTSKCKDVVDFGCGYGTFTIPAAKIVSSKVYSIDIEEEMLRVTQAKAVAAGLKNVETLLRDFVTEGTGLDSACCDYVMLFNILHCERPEVLLREAHRVVRKWGKLGIIHWRYDSATPRGPSMSIRPRPEQCQQWAQRAGFKLMSGGIFEIEPYHYGMVLQKEN